MISILRISYLALPLVLLLFQCSQTTYQSNYYVNKNANGNNNGTSWENAWESFSDIEWDRIKPGDTLFISGGTDSVVYSGPLEIEGSGSTDNYLYIIGGRAIRDSRHNGKAIISGGTNNIHIGNGSKGISWVWVKGLECTGADVKGVYLEDITDHIVLDSLYIHNYNKKGTSSGFGIAMIGSIKNTIIRYCKVIDMVDGTGQSDCVHINLDNGTPSRRPINTIVHNSYFRSRSQDPNAHNDAFQSVGCDGFIMFNNTLINDSVYSIEGGGMPFILSDVNYGNDNPVILFNNVAYMGGIWYPGANYSSTLRTRHDSVGDAAEDNQPSKVFIFNNTLLSNGPVTAVVEQEYLIHFFSNNILASWCSSNRRDDWHFNLEGSGGYGGYTGNLHIDSTKNNLIWRQDNTQSGLFAGSFGIREGGTFTPSNWADWVNNGGTGVNADPKLVYNVGNEPDQGALVPDLKSDSPAIDAGSDLSYLYDYFKNLGVPQFVLDALDKDFYGNPRNDGKWDIGAFEFK